MNEIDLKKTAEELEQTLKLQLAQFKKDSEGWVKVGGAVLAVSVVATVLVKRRKKKKRKKKDQLVRTAQVPVQKLKKSKPLISSVLSPVRKRILLALFSWGQARLMEELKRRTQKVNEG